MRHAEGVQRERLAHHLDARCSGLHNITASDKIRDFSPGCSCETSSSEIHIRLTVERSWRADSEQRITQEQGRYVVFSKSNKTL